MLELIISSSILVIVISVIRCLFRGKVDNRVIYAIWLLLVIKLVLPFPSYFLGKLDVNIFQIETPLSIMNIVNDWRLNENLEKNTIEHHDTQLQKKSENIKTDNKSQKKQKDNFGNGVITSRKEVDKARVYYLVYIIWILGSVFFFAFQIKNVYKLRRDLILNREEIKLLDQKVYVVKKLDTPLIIRGKGFKTDIYIPDNVAKDMQLVFHAILHENTHKKHGDVWWGYVRNILIAIYWFHPFVWFAAYLSKRDAEYACDSGVLEKINHDARIAYGESLLKLVEMNNNLTFCSSVTMSTGRSEMKRRIKMIKRGTKKSVLAVIAIIVLLLGTSAVCFTKAESKKKETTQISTDKNIGEDKNFKNVSKDMDSEEDIGIMVKKPAKNEIDRKRDEVFEGISESDRKIVVDKVKHYNLAIEHAYLWDNIFQKMKDPDNLHWNLLYEKGEIQIGWAFETGEEYNPEKTKLTEDDYNKKYGQKVICNNDITADDFIKEMRISQQLFKNRAIQSDFETIIENMEQAKKTRNVECLINIYKILHDMDYYLFRDKEEMEEYIDDTSLIDKYYGVLNIYQ